MMFRNFGKTLDKLHEKSTDENAQFYVFTVFLTLTFMLGGSARDDVQSLVVLRPLAFLFGAYALSCRASERWAGRTFPLYITLALAGLMVLQSIPLPPQIWAALPERHVFVKIAEMAELGQPWRPLTLSPSRTLNSLFSLAIPVSAIMLYLNLGKKHRIQAVTVLIVLVGISAILATLQLTSSAQLLYLYRITNDGSAVGLFANRNHQAILLAAAIVMLGWYGSSHAVSAKWSAIKFYASIAMIFVIVPLILLTGSRAGLILMGPATLIASLFMYFGQFAIESQSVGRRNKGKTDRPFARQLILVVSSVIIVTTVFLSVYFSRSLAFDRLVAGNGVDDLRTQLLPILAKMVADYFPWGSGFGTFEYVYRIYEPLELLSPAYLNHAHNDWLQFAVEGGVPAILIAMAAVIWAGMKVSALIKFWKRSRYTKYAAAMAITVMLLLLAGSVGDYPLRVPSLMAMFAILVCIFQDSVPNSKKVSLC